MTQTQLQPTSMGPMKAGSSAVWAGVAALVAGLVGGALALGSPLGYAIAGLTAAVPVMLWSLRRPELMLVALLAVASLDTMGRLLEVGPAKITAYQVVLLGVMLWFAWALLSRRITFRPTGVDAWVALTLAAALVVIPGALRPMASVVAFTSLASSLVVMYLVVNLAPDDRRLRSALVGFLLLAAGIGALAVVERAGIFGVQSFYSTTADGIRARVFFDDPNMLGGVLAAAGVVGLPLALSERRLGSGLVLWAATGMAAAGMLATLSRGALLGFVIGAAVAVFTAPVSRALRVALALAGAVGVVGVLVFVLDPAWVAEKLIGISSNRSALNRVYLAEAAAQMWASRPFGVGPGMWSQTILAYRPPDLPAGLLESHTTYLTVLVELGILGLIGLVGTIVGTFVKVVPLTWSRASQAHKALAAAALGGAVVFLVQSLTYSMETSKFLWFLLGACLAVAAAADDEGESA